MENEIPMYELDDDTLALLTTVLELAMFSSNLQLDSKNSERVMDIVFQTAHRFGIEFKLVEHTEFHEPKAQLDVNQFDFDIRVSFIDQDTATDGPAVGSAG